MMKTKEESMVLKSARGRATSSVSMLLNLMSPGPQSLLPNSESGKPMKEKLMKKKSRANGGEEQKMDSRVEDSSPIFINHTIEIDPDWVDDGLKLNGVKDEIDKVRKSSRSGAGQTCERCHRPYSSFQNHQKTCSERTEPKIAKEYRCQQCSITYKTNIGYLKHRRKNHFVPKKTKCSRCGQNFKTPKMTLHHLSSEECEKVICEKCNLIFASGEKYTHHTTSCELVIPVLTDLMDEVNSSTKQVKERVAPEKKAKRMKIQVDREQPMEDLVIETRTRWIVNGEKDNSGERSEKRNEEETLKWKTVLNKKYRKELNESDDKGPGRKESFICDLCDDEYSDHESYSLHLRRHAVKVTKCENCNEIVTQSEKVKHTCRKQKCEDPTVRKRKSPRREEATEPKRLKEDGKTSEPSLVSPDDNDDCGEDSDDNDGGNDSDDNDGGFASMELDSSVSSRSAKTRVKRSWSCVTCEGEFPSRKKLELHRRIYHPKPHQLFKCDVCSEEFTAKNALAKHKKSHYDKWKKCKICADLVSPELLLDHLRDHESQIPCKVCGKIVRKRFLESHLLAHTEIRILFDCYVCGKKFLTKKNLDVHSCPVAQAKVICKVCGQLFGAKYMAVHELTHSLVKPFKCLFCGVSYAQKKGLRVHQKTKHEGKTRPLPWRAPPVTPPSSHLTEVPVTAVACTSPDPKCNDHEYSKTSSSDTTSVISLPVLNGIVSLPVSSKVAFCSPVSK